MLALSGALLQHIVMATPTLALHPGLQRLGLCGHGSISRARSSMLAVLLVGTGTAFAARARQLNYFMDLTRKNISVSRTSRITPCSGLVGSVTITHPRIMDLTEINSALARL